MFDVFPRMYGALLRAPFVLLTFLLAVLALAAWQMPKFSFDASSDTLVSRADPDLIFYQELNKTFGAEEFLFLTYAPKQGELFSDGSLELLSKLQQEVKALAGVRGVFSVLDAPLLKSPPVELLELATGYHTLVDDEVDKAMALDELSSSPIFSDLLVSADGGSTALRIDLAPSELHDSLFAERERLRDSVALGNEADVQALTAAEEAYAAQRVVFLQQRDELLANIRQIRDSHLGEANLYLGGVPMVASDMIGFVKSDIVVFGALVLLVVMCSLWFFFRRMRWIVIPLLTAMGSIVLTVGLLAWMGQAATVISSNFISLLAILTISFSIHLVVRYRELFAQLPDASHRDLVVQSQLSKFAPIFYTALTTLVAFASLVSSDIVPVIDFGWIMCIGVALSFLSSVALYPALLLLLPKGERGATLGESPALTRWLAQLVVKASWPVLAATTLVAIVSVLGITRLSLDNRFIDYFRDGTEIREGMLYIDQHLGGTVPFDVVLKLQPWVDPAASGEDDEFAEDFADDFADDSDPDPYPQRYWFTPDKMALLAKLHDYIDSIPQVGKVLSMSSLEKVARDFNDGKPLDALVMAGVMGALPPEVRTLLVDPYANPEEGLLRIGVRVIESGEPFSRDDLLRSIDTYAQEELGLAVGQVRSTGMMVLFNNMLKQLFASQTSTLVFVIGATFLMFALLLRSIPLAFMGLLPNVIAAATVLGAMGYSGVPLDMMTITIAAISIGIGVDNAIHYLHRFKIEFEQSQDVIESVKRSHDSIGHALYYASFTIIAGFSILAFSNFIPTVYFGLLTALAMGLATMANLIVLPSLLIRFYR